jgi:hypothetical protein
LGCHFILPSRSTLDPVICFDAAMSAARILHIPLSGRDRRHYAAELRKAEQKHERFVREAKAAHPAADLARAEAYRLDCEAWTAGNSLVVLNGGCQILEVQCRHCNHTDMIDLALVTWQRSQPVHTIRRALYCAKCRKVDNKKRRPDLIGLRARPERDPTSPAAAIR